LIGALSARAVSILVTLMWIGVAAIAWLVTSQL
jgi:hypothetical protein